MWKKNQSFPNLEVSRDGRVRSWHNSWSRYVEKKKRLDKDGYETIGTRRENGKGTTVRVHRLVAETYLANPENKPVVNHLNGIKNDNRVENLRWSTVAENTQHGYDKLGVRSAKSKRIALYIDGNFFSTYDSISKFGEISKLNRNLLEKYEEESEGYLKFDIVEKDSYIHNKPLFKSDINFKSILEIYQYGDTYYGRVKDIADMLEVHRSTVSINLRKGHYKGKTLRKVSIEEYFKYSNNINW